MDFSTLYSRTSHGQIQVWSIFVYKNTYYTIEGIQNGKLTTSKPTVVKGKNIGRANETSDCDQTIKEAAAKHKKKIESGYFENLAHIDNEIHFEPMLAKNYADEYPITFPVYSQPKLDGMRCIAIKKGLFSRKGKPILSVPHIHEELELFFEAYPEAILDGELYCDKFANNFNSIISLCKKTKPTPEDFTESKKHIEYHIYDLPSSKTFGARLIDLSENLFKLNNSATLVQVKTTFIEKEVDLDSLYGQYIENGYEGQMVRIDAPYQNKRTKYLLKRKEFITEEYTILDIIEGQGGRAGTAGFMTFKNKDGKPFKSNIKGNFALLKEYLVNKQKYIGQEATIKYFNQTPERIPRFPFVIAIRNYE